MRTGWSRVGSGRLLGAAPGAGSFGGTRLAGCVTLGARGARATVGAVAEGPGSAFATRLAVGPVATLAVEAGLAGCVTLGARFAGATVGAVAEGPGSAFATRL
ncbi:hypothetical protein, partial [Albidovulum sp.]|uniref:hypothetical protein n=1 Tax=Albidovulum sp. TaxID=1872424 RepID=UPI003D7DFD66